MRLSCLLRGAGAEQVRAVQPVHEAHRLPPLPPLLPHLRGGLQHAAGAVVAWCVWESRLKWPLGGNSNANTCPPRPVPPSPPHHPPPHHPSPQGGSIKLYKELACPLDGFQLVLFSLGGADGKTYPLCPYWWVGQ